MLILIFRALRKFYKDPILSEIFCTAGKFLKNRAKNDVFGILRNIWPKNCVFSPRTPPSNSVELTPKAPQNLFDAGQP